MAHDVLKCIISMIEQNVCHHVRPVDQRATNMATMSYQRVALPLKMNVAVRFDVNNGGWAPLA
eukprot:12931767-Prorocentrum_lima.AAC.1